jgi:uncharacterized protein
MRTHSPLVLDVREVLESPGIRRPLRFSTPVPDLQAGLVKVTGDVAFDLTLEAMEGGVLVQGTMAGTYEGTCRRCLKPVTGTFELKGAEIYRPPAEVWEEGYVCKDSHVDLEPMLRDTVGLSLPLSPLCQEACAGLCQQCGKDLNEGPCDCDEPVDIRWSALNELKGKLNG